MLIWVVNTGEPLKIGDQKNRPFRTGLLVEELKKRGHKIVWFTSSFDHLTKTKRSNTTQHFKVDEQCDVVAIDAILYKKNIGIKRLLSHALLGARFFLYTQQKKIIKPDLIITSMPTIEMSAAAIYFAKKQNIPIVMDIRDQWPDKFVTVMSSRKQSFVKLAIKPYQFLLRYCCRNATSIIAINDFFLNWAVTDYAGHKKYATVHKVFTHAYSSRYIENKEDNLQGLNFWRGKGLNFAKNDLPLISFVGSINNSFNFEPIVKAAKQLEHRAIFVLAGTGDKLSELEKSIAQLDVKNILLTGWINQQQLHLLLTHSVLGLAPYRQTDDFKASIPNKPVEFFSYGLPVITGLIGELSLLIEKYNCGLLYDQDKPEKISSIIEQLLNNTEQYQAIRNNARKVYETFFDASNVISEMTDFILSQHK